MSLRRRVLAYVALAAIASCALTTAVAVLLVRHKVAAQRVTALETQANVLSLVGGAPGALTVGDHVYRVGSGRPRRVRPAVARAVAGAVPTAGDSEGTIAVGGRSLLYAVRATARGRVVLIRSARLAFAEWRPFLSSLVIAGLGGAVLAAILSFLLARRLLRPIDHLAEATRRVAAGETDVTVPVEGEDELAALGHSFNAMAAELAQAREAQRAFLESVSHELKTPLTSIRGYAEALEEGAVSPAEGGRVVAAEADRLQRLVFDL
ncbi:MAG TPA: HAMP domain-containing protein, partial [Solirubrobacteraceae bacterium]